MAAAKADDCDKSADSISSGQRTLSTGIRQCRGALIQRRGFVMRDMIVETDIEELGQPDLEFGGLQIWTHNRRYPESSNFWDVNWLNVTFCCRARGATVWAGGDILHGTEVVEWLIALEDLDRASLDEVTLPTLERHLGVKVKRESYARISMKIEITPDRVSQHYFEFWEDENYLDEIVLSCRGILAKFPIKGENRKWEEALPKKWQ